MRKFAFVMAALAALAAAPEALAQYSADALAAPVRDAVMTARAREAEANRAAERGREAAARADDAAERARRREPGYYVSTSDTDVYLGGWRNDVGNGAGVVVLTDASFNGDRYRGELVNGAYAGYGVYHWGENPNNAPGQLRFEGQFNNNAASGVGIRTYRNGETRAGEVYDWRTNGYVVQRLADGWRYEGQMAGGARQGYGVEWDPSGRVANAGVWQNNDLVNPLN